MQGQQLAQVLQLLSLLSHAWNGRSPELDEQLVRLRNQLMVAKPNIQTLLPTARRIARLVGSARAGNNELLKRQLDLGNESLEQLQAMEAIPGRFQTELAELKSHLANIETQDAWSPWLESYLAWHRQALHALASARRVAAHSGDQLLEALREQLVELLDRLIEQDLYPEQATGLRSQIQHTSGVQMGSLLNQSVSLAIRSLTHERNAFADYLRQLDQAISRVQQSLSQSLQGAERLDGMNEALHNRLHEHLEAIRQESSAADSLAGLQHQLTARLEQLAQVLTEQHGTQKQAYTDHRAELLALQQELDKTRAESAAYRQQAQQMARMSRLDNLTRLPNRTAYDERINQELDRLRRYGHPFVCAVLDIDHFKRINDQFGHQAGDRTLQVIAKTLRSTLRDSDFIGRYGGEEFVLLLPEQGFAEAEHVLERLRSKVASIPFRFREAALQITVSIGAAEATAGDSAEQLFERADQALYAAKAEGRNRLQLSDPLPA